VTAATARRDGYLLTYAQTTALLDRMGFLTLQHKSCGNGDNNSGGDGNGNGNGDGDENENENDDAEDGVRGGGGGGGGGNGGGNGGGAVARSSLPAFMWTYLDSAHSKKVQFSSVASLIDVISLMSRADFGGGGGGGSGDDGGGGGDGDSGGGGDGGGGRGTVLGVDGVSDGTGGSECATSSSSSSSSSSMPSAAINRELQRLMSNYLYSYVVRSYCSRHVHLCSLLCCCSLGGPTALVTSICVHSCVASP
jgi:hypothetical protein